MVSKAAGTVGADAWSALCWPKRQCSTHRFAALSSIWSQPAMAAMSDVADVSGDTAIEAIASSPGIVATDAFIAIVGRDCGAPDSVGQA